jgi:DNA replication protein DnaC
MSSRGGGLQTIANQAEAWAKRVYNNSRTATTLVLSGDSGTGKTLVSKCLKSWVQEHAMNMAMQGKWPRVPSIEWVDWVDWWQRYQGGRTHKDFGDIMDCDCLFLDDIGAEADRYKSGEAVAILCQLLGKRERKYNVITTNVNRKDWANHFDKRVADRLKRNEAEYCNFWTLKSYNE